VIEELPQRAADPAAEPELRGAGRGADSTVGEDETPCNRDARGDRQRPQPRGRARAGDDSRRRSTPGRSRALLRQRRADADRPLAGPAGTAGARVDVAWRRNIPTAHGERTRQSAAASRAGRPRPDRSLAVAAPVGARRSAARRLRPRRGDAARRRGRRRARESDRRHAARSTQSALRRDPRLPADSPWACAPFGRHAAHLLDAREGPRRARRGSQAPTDEPWGRREMALRSPDGHRFMLGRALLSDRNASASRAR
jgi:hypothetical protein